MNKFKIGDKVRVIAKGVRYLFVGTILDFAPSATRYGVFFEDEFPSGHDLGLGGHLCEKGHGWYFRSCELELVEVATTESTTDMVNHPPHYNNHPSGIECITITQHHDFCIGNAIKYLWRAGLKNGESDKKDLEKAIWYIKKKIEMLENKDL